MKLLAAYIMRGRMQAILVATVSAALSLLLPPLSYLSGGAVALVTLRAGLPAGLSVAAGGTVALALLGVATVQSAGVGPLFLVGVWAPVLIAAHSLRRTVSLPRSVLLAGMLGALVVLGMHWALEDPARWWQEHLQRFLLQSMPEGESLSPQMASAVVKTSGFITGLLGAGMAMSVMLGLFIGRWWQALLYNPGGFQQEFHRLRLSRQLGITVVVLLAIGALMQPPALLVDLLIVLMVLLVIQGVALIHGLVGGLKAHRAWLIGVYALLFIAPPQALLLLAVAGFADGWFDFRAFFTRGEDT